MTEEEDWCKRQRTEDCRREGKGVRVLSVGLQHVGDDSGLFVYRWGVKGSDGRLRGRI